MRNGPWWHPGAAPTSDGMSMPILGDSQTSHVPPGFKPQIHEQDQAPPLVRPPPGFGGQNFGPPGLLKGPDMLMPQGRYENALPHQMAPIHTKNLEASFRGMILKNQEQSASAQLPKHQNSSHQQYSPQDHFNHHLPPQQHQNYILQQPTPNTFQNPSYQNQNIANTQRPNTQRPQGQNHAPHGSRNTHKQPRHDQHAHRPAVGYIPNITDQQAFPPLGAQSATRPQSQPLPQRPSGPATSFRNSSSTKMDFNPTYTSFNPAFNRRGFSTQTQTQFDNSQQFGRGGGGRGGDMYNRNFSRMPNFLPQDQYLILTEFMMHVIQAHDPTEGEYEMKTRMLQQIYQIVNKVLPGSQLIPFGSLVSGFAAAKADMDLVLVHDSADPHPASPESPVPVELASEFLRRGFSVALLAKTRVPILKLTTPLENKHAHQEELFKDSQQAKSDDLSEGHIEIEHFEDEVWPGGVSCDIGFSNHLGMRNTQMLRTYSICDPRVRQMVMFVKHWAHTRNVNSAYHGSLSSYGWVLLILHFLINVVKPPILPNLQLITPPPETTQEEIFSPEGYNYWFYNDREELTRLKEVGDMTLNRASLGELLCAFFHYYANRFDFRNDVISIRTRGGVLAKAEKDWTSAISRTGNMQASYRDRYLFAIEDPFETTHNVGRTCSQGGVRMITEELQRADMLLRRMHNPRAKPLDELLKPGREQTWWNKLSSREATERRRLVRLIKNKMTVGEWRDVISEIGDAEDRQGQQDGTAGEVAPVEEKETEERRMNEALAWSQEQADREENARPLSEELASSEAKHDPPPPREFLKENSARGRLR